MTEADTNREPNNLGMKAEYVPSPENDFGMSSGILLNGEKMWITSDTHFWHRNILVYEAANRPFKDVYEMNETMVQKWNEKVGKDDIVLHLGDFSFGSKSKAVSIAQRLNGRIWLLLGNHDRQQKYDLRELGFERLIRDPFLLDRKFVFSHEPLAQIPDGLVNIYGHVHGSRYCNTKDDNRLCACVERWDCAPIEYEYVRGLFV